MWQNANPGSTAQIEIKETSITGNMELSKMLEKKIKWKTVDDKKEGFFKKKLNFDFTPDSVKLEPQRIRTFMV